MVKIFSNKSPLDAEHINYNPANLTDSVGLLDTIQPIGVDVIPTFSGMILFDPLAISGTAIGSSFADALDDASTQINYAGWYAVLENNSSTNPQGSFRIAVKNGLGGVTDFLISDGVSGTNKAVKPLRLMTEGAGGLVYTDSNNDLRAIASPQSYTPLIGDGVNNFTTSTAIGKYWPVGNLYFIDIHAIWTNKGGASPGANLAISLPLSIGPSYPRATASLGVINNITWTGATLTCSGQSGQSVLNLFGISNGGGATPVTVLQAGTTGELQLSGFYGTN